MVIVRTRSPSIGKALVVTAGNVSSPQTLAGLLVEDDEVFARYVGQVLRTSKGLRFDLEWTDRLSGALERLRKQRFDFVLLDLRLPDSEGLQTVHEVQAAAPLVPLVVISSDADADRALRAVRSGAQDYVLKGHVDTQRLTLVIRHAIERRAAEGRLRTEEARLAEVFAQMPAGVILIDPQDRVLLANPLAQEYLLGLVEPRVREGDRLVALGGVPLAEIEGSTRVEGKGWRGRRSFEVESRTLPAASVDGEGGRLIVLREHTEDDGLRRSLDMQQRIAAVGALAATLSERFEDSLEVLRPAVDALGEPEEFAEEVTGARIRAIRANVARAEGMVEQIVRFCQDPGGPARRVDLAKSLFEIGDVLHHLLPEHIDVEVEVEPSEYGVMAAPADLQQLFTNLAINARDAMPEGGRLTLSLTKLVLAPSDLLPAAGMTAGRWLVASVADTGVGVDPELLNRIFDPFFTTKSGALATGLGLTQVFGLVRKVGGFVTVRRRSGPGTRFLVYLPAASEEARSQEVAPPPGLVLVVEPPGLRRRRIVELLGSLGYECQVADAASAGIQSYLQDRHRIDAVICSSEAPFPGAYDGLDLANALHELDPLVRVLVLTGRSPSARSGEGHPAVYGWVQEPVEVLGLQAALSRATQGRS